ncbi:6-aminohexanoate-dimer hydrolase [Botrimarina colliarenosi]|uniref:6-aminohexanoate-dimer hydrolase n=1 Tax=Botrimarina colliarenosi TaxID=2528001 RepID=A0A5C6AFG3_9BACT|nr:serine hydrolase [Botrimarina colliarenosi]TWT98170.1 6-aminohexanoate-dimer hydrolase [Botrimarina colliarenosi]
MPRAASLLFLAFTFLSAAFGADLPRATPESQGVPSGAIIDFVEHASTEIDTLNSFMLVRHGKVIAEGWWAPYRAEDTHMLYSLSKSFTSTAVGMAIAEEKLSLDDRVLDWFPDLAPAEPAANLRAMRVRDLLRMATGHFAEQVRNYPWDAGSPAKRFLSLPVELKPGTHFMYNTPATYMASAMVQRATGQTVHEYLGPRLFKPLGIEGSWWETSVDGVSMGGFGLNLRTEDIAKFGQLLLQRGQWNGKQLVSAAWIDEATALQTSNGSDPNSEWEQGYGYQFWRCSTGGYRADGACGQFCLVLPEEDAVIAVTSGTADMGRVMKLAWTHLQDAMQQDALPENAAEQRKLKQTLAKLQIPTPQGAATSPMVEDASGSVYRIADDPLGLRALALRFDGEGHADGATLVYANDDGRQRIALGHGEWKRGSVTSVKGLSAMLNSVVAPPSGAYPVAAAGAWESDDTYQARVCLTETPYYVDVTLHFAEDGVTIDAKHNAVLSGEREQPKRVGTR